MSLIVTVTPTTVQVNQTPIIVQVNSGATIGAGGSGTPVGPAGGDLSGTYPNPQVAGLLNKALPALSTGYLKYTGSIWAISLVSLTTDVSGILPIANGGTGTNTPSLVAGTNVTITGSWPNQTINSSGGGGGSNPFSDASALVKNSADATKLLIISTASISTATTRTWTVPDVNGTFARIDAAQTFTGIQSFLSNPILNTTSVTGQVWTATNNTGSGNWATFSGLTNPMTTLGDIIYENATPAPTRLIGNTTSGIQFLTQTGTGVISAAPVWHTLVAGDIPALAYWSLASGGVLTGFNRITNNFANNLIFDGTWTATASTDVHASFQGNLTASSSGGVVGYIFNPSLTAAGTSSVQIAVSITPTFSGGTTPANIALYVNGGTTGPQILVGTQNVVFGAVNDVVLMRRDQNSSSLFTAVNTSATALASSGFAVTNSTTATTYGYFTFSNPSFTTVGARVASTVSLVSTATGGLNLGTNANTQMGFFTNSVQVGTFLAGGNFLVGYSAVANTEIMGMQKNQNANTRFAVSNTTSGTASAAQVLISGSATFASFGAFTALSALFTTSGMFVQNTFTLSSTGGAGLNVGSSDAQQFSIWTNGLKRIAIDSNGLIVNTQTAQAVSNTFWTWTQAVHTGGTPNLWVVTGGAHTGLATGTEAIDINFALNRTVAFAGTTTIAQQRAIVLQAPTYSAGSATTMTIAATMAITGAPAQASLMTITNTYGLWISTGAVAGKGLLIQGFSGQTQNAHLFEVQTSGSTVIGFIDGFGQYSLTPSAVTSGFPGPGFIFSGASHTGLTASTELTDFSINISRTVQFATGALATQRAVLIGQPTYAFVGASTITNAASFAIAGAPQQGTNATITNALALWIQAGNAQFDGTNVVLKHIVGQGTTPGIAAGTGAGTTPTVSVTGTDVAGYISVTTGTTPTASATVVTITFNIAYTSAPRCIILTPANSNSDLLGTTANVYVNQAGITTTTFAVTVGSTGLTAATAYQWFYSVIQ